MKHWGVYERPSKARFVLYSPEYGVPEKLDIGVLIHKCDDIREASLLAAANPRVRP